MDVGMRGIFTWLPGENIYKEIWTNKANRELLLLKNGRLAFSIWYWLLCPFGVLSFQKYEPVGNAWCMESIAQIYLKIWGAIKKIKLEGGATEADASRDFHNFLLRHRWSDRIFVAGRFREIWFCKKHPDTSGESTANQTKYIYFARYKNKHKYFPILSLLRNFHFCLIWEGFVITKFVQDRGFQFTLGPGRRFLKSH